MYNIGNKLFVITLGYDESHAIRSLMLHNKLSEGDLVLFVVPRGGTKNERTREALRTIENVVRYSTTGRDFYEVLELDVPEKENPLGSFYKSLSRLSRTIIEKIKEINASEIIFDISGGMRILTVIGLLSAYIVSSRVPKRPVRIEIETEDKVMHVSIPTKVFNVILGSREMLVLRILEERGPMSAKDLKEETKMSRTTLYYTLRDLMKENLVENVQRKYRITETGKAILYLNVELERAFF